jgi:hypothetical protein
MSIEKNVQIVKNFLAALGRRGKLNFWSGPARIICATRSSSGSGRTRSRVRW